MPSKGPQRPFFEEPVFACGLGVYLLNRFVLKPWLGPENAFFHGQLNDLLLVPCALPPICYLYSRLGLRKREGVPTWGEIGLHWLIWSAFFEGLGPWMFGQGTGDLWDVVAYGVGGVLAGAAWHGVPSIFSRRSG